MPMWCCLRLPLLARGLTPLPESDAFRRKHGKRHTGLSVILVLTEIGGRAMSDEAVRKKRAGGRAGNKIRAGSSVIDQMPWRIPVNPDRPPCL